VGASERAPAESTSYWVARRLKAPRVTRVAGEPGTGSTLPTTPTASTVKLNVVEALIALLAGRSPLRGHPSARKTSVTSWSTASSTLVGVDGRSASTPNLEAASAQWRVPRVRSWVTRTRSALRKVPAESKKSQGQRGSLFSNENLEHLLPSLPRDCSPSTESTPSTLAPTALTDDSSKVLPHMGWQVGKLRASSDTVPEIGPDTKVQSAGTDAQRTHRSGAKRARPRGLTLFRPNFLRRQSKARRNPYPSSLKTNGRFVRDVLRITTYTTC
jgi:hypothetical protein